MIYALVNIPIRSKAFGWLISECSARHCKWRSHFNCTLSLSRSLSLSRVTHSYWRCCRSSPSHVVIGLSLSALLYCARFDIYELLIAPRLLLLLLFLLRLVACDIITVRKYQLQALPSCVCVAALGTSSHLCAITKFQHTVQLAPVSTDVGQCLIMLAAVNETHSWMWSWVSDKSENKCLFLAYIIVCVCVCVVFNTLPKQVSNLRLIVNTHTHTYMELMTSRIGDCIPCWPYSAKLPLSKLYMHRHLYSNSLFQFVPKVIV